MKEDHEAPLLRSMLIRFAVRKRCYTGVVTVVEVQMAARRIGWIGQMLEKVFIRVEQGIVFRVGYRCEIVDVTPIVVPGADRGGGVLLG